MVATIIANGCFDVFHEGHERFLYHARRVGWVWPSSQLKELNQNKLVVAVNSDESARALKLSKWGEKYPIDHHLERMANVSRYADVVVGFETEEQLHQLIENYMPCIIVKGPDYAGKSVTGDDLAPVLILDTPEPESVKEMKRRVYSNDSVVEK